ncbi:MAG: PLD nuclease N-terminal domain-containing protein [Actinomycetes bacterium]
MRFLLYVIPLAIQIYGLFDCARTPQDEIRNLPKWGWLLVVLFLATLGTIAWFIAGRPKRSPNQRPRRQVPPDDDPDFLKNL